MVFEDSTGGSIEVPTSSEPVEVPTSGEIMGAREELPMEGNEEELIVEDEQAKIKGKRRAPSSEQGWPRKKKQEGIVIGGSWETRPREVVHFSPILKERSR